MGRYYRNIDVAIFIGTDSSLGLIYMYILPLTSLSSLYSRQM
jgi:hypothetical protein